MKFVEHQIILNAFLCKPISKLWSFAKNLCKYIISLVTFFISPDKVIEPKSERFLTSSEALIFTGKLLPILLIVHFLYRPCEVCQSCEASIFILVKEAILFLCFSFLVLVISIFTFIQSYITEKLIKKTHSSTKLPAHHVFFNLNAYYTCLMFALIVVSIFLADKDALNFFGKTYLFIAFLLHLIIFSVCLKNIFSNFSDLILNFTLSVFYLFTLNFFSGFAIRVAF